MPRSTGCRTTRYAYSPPVPRLHEPVGAEHRRSRRSPASPNGNIACQNCFSMAQQAHGNLGAEILANLSYAAVLVSKTLAKTEQTRRHGRQGGIKCANIAW